MGFLGINYKEDGLKVDFVFLRKFVKLNFSKSFENITVEHLLFYILSSWLLFPIGFDILMEQNYSKCKN